MIACVIVANNRPDYLEATLAAVKAHHPELQPIIVNDALHEGMAVNVARAWQIALSGPRPEFLFHLEDDMVIQQPLPLHEAAAILRGHPHIANIIFQRQPWNDIEHEAGGVHAAIAKLSEYYRQHATWAEHDHIFSLNPCLIPRHILEMGWPTGNEAEMTARLKGYRFGIWGHPEDAPLIEHIGYERGPGWQL